MSWPTAALGDLCQINIGRTPSRSVSDFWEGGDNPWLSISDMGRSKEIWTTKEGITQAAIHECNMRLVNPGTVLFSFKLSIGKVGIASIPLFTNEAIASLPILDPGVLYEGFLIHALETVSQKLVGDRAAMGMTLNKSSLAEIRIPLPPLEEQQRIAAILDKKEYLKKLIFDQQSLYRAAEISMFYEEFGSPISNPFKWPNAALGEIADIFSDGPFGSNLKSSHYTDTGIRVIRLQNIGIGEFVDDDKSFISESHYETIKKHSCLPGDILIGTLGDPNLRACTLPRAISIAINKADCIQMRCKETLCTKEFIVQLLNLPATNKMASSLILGQTRGRISMGRLKTFEIPLPPLERQAKFVQIINLLRQLKIKNKSSMATACKGFKSYSSKIFSFRAHQ